MRFSEWYVARCTKHGWLDFTSGVQAAVAAAFGVGLEDLRRAHLLFPDQLRLRTASVYVRENKAREGSLRAGDVLPSTATVRRLLLPAGTRAPRLGAECSVASLLPRGGLLVVGSMT